MLCHVVIIFYLVAKLFFLKIIRKKIVYNSIKKNDTKYYHVDESNRISLSPSSICMYYLEKSNVKT